MQKYLKAICATTIILTISLASCATLGSYSLTPLNQRHLRISKKGAYTEYRWSKPYRCGFAKLFTCYEEEVVVDFDFTKPEDRVKFNDMGFDCSVRKRP